MLTELADPPVWSMMSSRRKHARLRRLFIVDKAPDFAIGGPEESTIFPFWSQHRITHPPLSESTLTADALPYTLVVIRSMSSIVAITHLDADT